MSAVNRCPGKSRWETAASQNVIRREVINVAVKDFELRRLDIHSTYDQPDRA